MECSWWHCSSKMTIRDRTCQDTVTPRTEVWEARQRQLGPPSLDFSGEPRRAAAVKQHPEGHLRSFNSSKLCCSHAEANEHCQASPTSSRNTH